MSNRQTIFALLCALSWASIDKVHIGHLEWTTFQVLEMTALDNDEKNLTRQINFFTDIYLQSASVTHLCHGKKCYKCLFTQYTGTIGRCRISIF